MKEVSLNAKRTLFERLSTTLTLACVGVALNFSANDRAVAQPVASYSGPSPVYSPYLMPGASPVAFGTVYSFNNSFPTFVNGYPVYTGLGVGPPSGPVTFNNSFPTYINGHPVYAGAGFGGFAGTVTFNNSYPTYVNGAPVYAGSLAW